LYEVASQGYSLYCALQLALFAPQDHLEAGRGVQFHHPVDAQSLYEAGDEEAQVGIVPAIVVLEDGSVDRDNRPGA